jgi:GTP-binding protein
MSVRKPLVALVGRPNVGKSALFNRLVGERMAVVGPIPGTTRDRSQADFEWRSTQFMAVDTGGIEVYEPKGSRDESPLSEGSADFVQQIRTQALIAIQDADVIVMVVDILAGVTAADLEVAEILRRTQKPVVVAANKADDMKRNPDAAEFYALGVGEVFAVSAIHGLGVGDLLDSVYYAVEEMAKAQNLDDDESDTLKIAIVGRPNVGKSSMVNRLLGEERMIVSPIAGTTRDAIDSTIQFNGQPVTLIDTAGIRRRGKIEPGVEKYSVLRAMRAIERADVVLLLIDGESGLVEQDLHIAGYVLEAGKSIILVVNKWDAVEKDSQTMVEFERYLRHRFDFLPDSPIVYTSALTGQRIHTVLETAYAVWENRHFRIPTSELNRLVREAMHRHTPTVRGTRRMKILYASQVRTNPPLILFHVNDPRLVHFTYKRYLENQIRAEYPFAGTPIRLSFRGNDGLKDE